MPTHPPRTRTRRMRIPALTAVVASVLGTGAMLLAPVAAHAAPPLPPNPSDSQIRSAAAQKAALAQQIGTLTAQLAQQQSLVAQSQAASEVAEQKMAYSIEQEQIAEQKAAQAQANLKAARQKVVDAQKRFTAYVQAAYMSGQLDDETGILLTASDPSTMLAQSTLRNYQATHQLNAVGDMQRATVAVSNAQAQARETLKAKIAAKAAAKQAAADALAAYQANVAQQQQYQAQMTTTQTKLGAAQLALATLQNQRATYLKALAIRQAQERAAAEARARAAALARARSKPPAGGGGGGSSGGGGGTYTPPPSGGSWTPQKGAAAASRALAYVGYMYAWAGGNASGPTRGVCAGDGAWNDCNIVGFDCSGLTLYGWAPYTYLAHWTVNQYQYGGHYRPSMNNLMKGDLLFWSNGGVSGIHHVAMYIGNGQMVEAPESGVPIRVASIWEYGQPFGTVRPMT